MRYDDYEKEIIESIENNEWQPIDNLEEEKERISQIAKNTFNKNKRINIRLTERDLTGIKVKSIEEGMPYQTLIASIIHKYINGRLTEKLV
jgi:predicted DNA binding CopG/RHH family protein